jgi:hypothetical protein
MGIGRLNERDLFRTEPALDLFFPGDGCANVAELLAVD